MCATYGGVARKHPQLVLNAFYNHMYGQIIDWALEAMNVEPDKSDWFVQFTFYIGKRRKHDARKECAGLLPGYVSGRLYPNRDFSRNAEEAAAERSRTALERQPAFQYTPHRKSGGEEMRIDNTAQEKRKKKKQQTQLE